jgi:hypothetical protein
VIFNPLQDEEGLSDSSEDVSDRIAEKDFQDYLADVNLGPDLSALLIQR